MKHLWCKTLCTISFSNACLSVTDGHACRRTNLIVFTIPADMLCMGCGNISKLYSRSKAELASAK